MMYFGGAVCVCVWRKPRISPDSMIWLAFVLIACSLVQATLLCMTRNRPISQISQCTCPISHNAPFRTEMCTFLFWMVYFGVWNRCIVRFVKWIYCSRSSPENNGSTDLRNICQSFLFPILKANRKTHVLTKFLRNFIGNFLFICIANRKNYDISSINVYEIS